MLKGIKSIISIACFTAMASTSFGQWSIGPRVAIGTVATGEQEIRIIPHSDELPPEMTFLGGNGVRSIGFMLYNQIGPGFLQLEALGTKYDLEFSVLNRYARSDAGVQQLTETNFIFEVPVSAGMTYRNVKIGAGPVLEVVIDKESELESISRYQDKANKVNGGFQGLIGYKKGKIHFDMKYIYRFSGIVDGFGIGSDNLRLNKSANRLTFAVGMTF